MTRSKKVLIGIGLLVVVGGIAYANIAFKKAPGTTVNVEKVEKRDLEAIVSASGKIQPKKSVQISAETMGKVVNLAVEEGDMVKAGQALLQIDPRNLETNVQNREANLSTARSTLDQTRSQIESARTNLKQAQDTLARQEAQMKAGLISKEQYDRAVTDAKNAATSLQIAEQSVKTQETRIKVEETNLKTAQNDLSKVRLVSPIDGLVTRRNIEEGETAVVGTMNNAGTVLLTIADMSVIEAEVEVDETDIPYISKGQKAKITIDALQDKTFTGTVTEVGNSPIQAAGTSATRATNFKVVVTIDGRVEGVRPGFTCTAVITTATREKVVAAPIQATTVREMVVDDKGAVVHPDVPADGKAPTPAARVATSELKPGQTRKELEGVFTVQNGRAVFVPIKTGIAGEKYFEVLSGVKEGEQVIVGPFASVRSLKDGDAVKVEAAITSPADAKK